jgi:hypothetical protein
MIDEMLWQPFSFPKGLRHEERWAPALEDRSPE